MWHRVHLSVQRPVILRFTVVPPTSSRQLLGHYLKTDHCCFRLQPSKSIFNIHIFGIKSFKKKHAPSTMQGYHIAVQKNRNPLNARCYRNLRVRRRVGEQIARPSFVPNRSVQEETG